ncbi:MAG: peptidase S9 [Bryobacteraceae bacterium]|nr:MAG: peptidase S9 [Bryobacteraceae bacterium]
MNRLRVSPLLHAALVSFLTLLPLAAPGRAQTKKPVTLEALAQAGGRVGPPMAQPFWSPRGGRLAVIRGDRLLLQDAASGEEKEIASLAELGKRAAPYAQPEAMMWENRRVREQRVAWSQDGTKLLILAGGDLFLWDEAAGQVEQLTSTPVPERDPKLSPDGTKVSFRRGRELFVLEVASKKVIQLTHDSSETRWNAMLDWVYPEELDLGTAHWWSPDSTRIAYMQFDVSREPLYPHGDFLRIQAVGEPQRYPKAGQPNADVRVGVVAAAGGPTRWMDFGETRDHLVARVHWSPDSRSVLAHRLNRVQNHLWILAADAGSGQSRLLIEETDPAWINITDDFHVLPDGRILRTSEQSGFRHIYLHDASGKLLRQLTRGDWEVTGIACVDAARQAVYFTSTEVSPLERHLYRTDFQGGPPRRLTEAAGTHSIQMSPACDDYLDTFSSLDSPPRTTLHDSSGKQLRVWREADTKILEEYEILKTEIHRFQGSDGTVFYGRLIRPVHFDPKKKYPAIVTIYGGPHAQSVRNAWPGGINWEQVMAHRGFVIWQMDNRGSSGRGHRFETPLYRRLGRQELADQLEGIRYLTGLGFVDPERIGVQGWSYGGFMTLYCLLHAPEVFRAGAAGAAVTDWRNYDTIYTERYLGLPEENEEGYRESSPVHHAANLKGRLLLIHNIEDDNVLFANALQMMNALQSAGKSFQTLIYPQKSHGLMGKASQHRWQEQTRFFEEALR